MNFWKASGPDGIPFLVLRELAPNLAPVIVSASFFALILIFSINAGRVHMFQPISKRGNNSDLSYYRPIALT